MYGWRGRIGLLTPSVNSVVEPEMHQMAPDGVAVFSSRMPLQDSHELAGVEDLVMNAAASARELAAARVGVIAFACTTGSFYQGVEAERKLQADIEAAAGVPAVTAMGSVVEALDTLSAGRIAPATPYGDRSNALVADYLGATGHDVVASRGLGISDTALTGETGVSLQASEDGDGWEVGTADEDRFCILRLETASQPVGELVAYEGVVTSNQAMAWACFERLGVSSRAGERYGRLMTMSSPQRAIAPTLDIRSALEPVEA
jgi:maleate cis-trans isomerase